MNLGPMAPGAGHLIAEFRKWRARRASDFLAAFFRVIGITARTLIDVNFLRF